MTETDDNRPLDVRVAEDVMGWTNVREHQSSDPNALWSSGLPPNDTIRRRLPNYSIDKAAAHMVLDRLNELGYTVEVNFWADGDVAGVGCGDVTVLVVKARESMIVVADAHGPFAEAVCEAALEAVKHGD